METRKNLLDRLPRRIRLILPISGITLPANSGSLVPENFEHLPPHRRIARVQPVPEKGGGRDDSALDSTNFSLPPSVPAEEEDDVRVTGEDPVHGFRESPVARGIADDPAAGTRDPGGEPATAASGPARCRPRADLEAPLRRRG
jgi:hypothetical protein